LTKEYTIEVNRVPIRCPDEVTQKIGFMTAVNANIPPSRWTGRGSEKFATENGMLVIGITADPAPRGATHTATNIGVQAVAVANISTTEEWTAIGTETETANGTAERGTDWNGPAAP